MTSWRDEIVLPIEVPVVLEGFVILSVSCVGKAVPYERLRRLRYQPEVVMARLFSLWCHKRGYFYSRAEPLCAVRLEIQQLPEMRTALYHFFADYGVPD